MTNDKAREIAEAYRWQRRLGNECAAASHCHVIANSSFPLVWDANHADDVTARTEDEILEVFAAMNARLGHTPFRVVHTDGFTPDAFLARLAFDDFEERPVTIQMILEGPLTDRGPAIDLRPVTLDADWAALQTLVGLDHAEGRKTIDLDLGAEFTAAAVASYRSKAPDYRYCLVFKDGEAAAYGAYAVAPNGAGLIEDLFTLPAARRHGLATAMIAAFSDRLRDQGCSTIFLGALAGERPKRLYARLGFRPTALARTWVKEGGAQGGSPPAGGRL